MQRYWLSIKTFVILLLILSCFAMIMADDNSQILNGEDYDLQVVKFYYQKQEFDTVLNYITGLEEDTYISDSLKFYQALSFSGLKNWQEAASIYSELLVHSVDQYLCSTVVSSLPSILHNIPTFDRIDLISNILTELRIDEYRVKLLFILADIYEEAHLFEEANDVYLTILLEPKMEDKFSVDLKIAANHIFLKEYLAALDILKPIISLQDSTLNSEALFLSYKANNSLNIKEEAKNNLISLYVNYPTHEKRFEIMNDLAEIYLIEGQYLSSWYLFEELKSISDATQLYVIENKIIDLRILISSQEDLPLQFENFRFKYKEN